MSPLHFDYSNLRQVLLQAVIIVCFGVSTGLMFNYPVLMKAFDGGAPKSEKSVAGPVSFKEPRVALLEDVERMMATAILVDARIPELYTEGHLPGAVSLPFAELEGFLNAFRARVKKGEQVIIYCSGYGCPDSFDLALLLLAEGYQDVSIFEGGYPQWRDAGRALEEGAQ